MIQRLTGDAKRNYWINTDHIRMMEVVEVSQGFASTRIIFQGGGSEMVYESPDDIMKFVNRSSP
jgi:hypothetical protein